MRTVRPESESRGEALPDLAQLEREVDELAQIAPHVARVAQARQRQRRAEAVRQRRLAEVDLTEAIVQVGDQEISLWVLPKQARPHQIAAVEDGPAFVVLLDTSGDVAAFSRCKRLRPALQQTVTGFWGRPFAIAFRRISDELDALCDQALLLRAETECHQRAAHPPDDAA